MIHSESWKVAYKGIVTDEILNNITPERREKYFERALTEGLEEDAIIFKDDKAVGLICIGKCRDIDKEDSYGEIWGIYLLPKYWNIGIGTKLISWGLDELKKRNYRKVTLWVLEDNLNVRKFYEKIGFEHDGTIKKINSLLNRILMTYYIVACFICITLFSACNISNAYNAKIPKQNQNVHKSTSTTLKNPLSSDENKMMNTIKSLCIKPRVIGSKDEEVACEFLRKELELYGYETYIQNFAYRKERSGLRRETFWKVDISDKDKDGNSQNLIAVKKPIKNVKNEIIVITAHYDSTKNSQGANDNASGVAVLLEVARQLKDLPSNIEIRFIFFSGEENLMFGSRYYISKLSNEETKRIKANINIDTVAQKQLDINLLTCNGKDNAASLILKNVQDGEKLKTISGGLSDYFTFSQANIPSANIGQWGKGLKFNVSDDVVSIIDKSKLKIAANMIINAVFREMNK